MSPPDPKPAKVTLLQAPSLQAISSIVHGFTTRDGGLSVGHCGSLNLSTRTGDARLHVFANRQRVLQRLGREDAIWVGLKQVHGSDVVEVTHGVGPNINADGLLTQDPKAAIAVLGADCLPILMANRAGTVLGAAHAGWRGTRAQVAGQLAQRLHKHGVAWDQLVVALGPAIGPCCYEVDEDVAQALQASCPDEPQAAVAQGDGKFRVDLWQINRRTLINAGVVAEAIDTVRFCTHCDSRFFSHRREHGTTGRQAGIIAFAKQTS